MKPNVLFLVLLCAATQSPAADVTLHAIDIEAGDYSVTPFVTTDGLLSFTESSGFWSVGAAVAPNSFGGSGAAGNANAFDHNDAATMAITFASSAGLRQIGTIWSRASVTITGFLADPVLSVDGVAGATATYDAGTGTVTLSQPWGGGTVNLFRFGNPAASAGQTLDFTFDRDIGGGDGYQLAINRIVYEDALALSAPVITTGLDGAMAPVADTETTLAVEIDTSVLPAPTYNWEHDNGGGFVSVGTGPTHTFTAGPATDGSYRVTVSNSEGSDSSSTVVTSTDDGDGINNQWEIDYFGDHLLYDGTDDVEPDGLTNAEEIAAGTDPTLADTDRDGLGDGDEAGNNTDPLDPDSDADGYSDGHEVNVSGTAPDDPDSTPGTDDGRNAIGVTFASTRGLNPGVNLSPLALAGAPGYGQGNWNVTGPLGNIDVIRESEVAAPVAGALVDSSGATTSVLMDANVESTWSTVFNPQQPVSGLLSGYLFVTTNTPTGTLGFVNIPYERYDLVVYLITQNGNAGDRAYISESSSSAEYTLTAPVPVPDGEDPVWSASADGSNLATGQAENFPRATHVIFRGLTASDPVLTLSFISGNIGFAAVQVVEDLDSDGDGMGDHYEASVGLDPADDGTGDPVREGADGDFDGDGVSNLEEHDNGTHPAVADTDGDGYDDGFESDTGSFGSVTDTGTDPRIADTDGDGVPDGAETNSGEFVDAGDAGTDPLGDGDSDLDGWRDSYEVRNGPTDPFDPAVPGGPNPVGFGIAFSSSSGPGAAIEFGDLVHAGAPGVEQKNWNRTIAFANTASALTGGIADIDAPNFQEIVDSAGNVIGDGSTGVTLSFSSGGSAYASNNEGDTPYGRLFSSFIYGLDGDSESTVTLGNIPYARYDAYVYIGSDTNNRQGTVTSPSAGGATYSFTTGSNALPASGLGALFVETADTGTGYPKANYAVFRGQTSPSFEVTTAWTTPGGWNLGIFGVQIVESSGGATLVLTNPVKNGNVFSADFTTDVAGTFVLERSATLDGGWSPVGVPFSVGAGTSPVSDPASSGTGWFYRVRQQ